MLAIIAGMSADDTGFYRGRLALRKTALHRHPALSAIAPTAASLPGTDAKS
jgi:hypothetical protein